MRESHGAEAMSMTLLAELTQGFWEASQSAQDDAEKSQWMERALELYEDGRRLIAARPTFAGAAPAGELLGPPGGPAGSSWNPLGEIGAIGPLDYDQGRDFGGEYAARDLQREAVELRRARTWGVVVGGGGGAGGGGEDEARLQALMQAANDLDGEVARLRSVGRAGRPGSAAAGGGGGEANDPADQVWGKRHARPKAAPLDEAALSERLERQTHTLLRMGRAAAADEHNERAAHAAAVHAERPRRPRRFAPGAGAKHVFAKSKAGGKAKTPGPARGPVWSSGGANGETRQRGGAL